MAISPGTCSGRYLVTALVGSGGMGEVYKAHDPRLGRDVAIKVLPAFLADSTESQRRFEREMQTISSLNHKNICTIYDTGEHEGQPFIVMELLEGQTLDKVLESGPLPTERILEVTIQVADALDTAHRHDIVHRDIKPSNIFLNRRSDAKVLDFGVAKVPRADGRDAAEVDTLRTAVGTAVGTLRYMSPEQAQGEEVDARSDLFSLGLVMYQMATGALPFNGSGTSVLFQLTSPQPVPSASTLNRALPPDLDRIIQRALEKDREVRYQTARDLLADLRRLRRDIVSGRTGASSGAQAVVGPVAGGRSPRRWLYLAVAVAGAAAAVSAWRVLPGLHRVPASVGSIAVLPCSGIDGAAGTDYHCDILTENIIANLSQIPGLIVKSYQAVEPYKNSPLSPLEAGRALDVHAVVTVRPRDAEGLEYSVEVTDVRNGAYLWGERFTGAAGGEGGFQKAVAIEVAEGLQLRLSAQARARLAVYQTYQEARHYWSQRTSASLAKAVDLFRTALRDDPGFAPAQAGLASSYVLMPYYGGLSHAEAYTLAKQAALEALGLDESLAEAHAALGLVKRDYERDWSGAEQEFKRAIELGHASHSGSALQWYAELLAMAGRFDEAEQRIEEAQLVEPLSLAVRAVHGWILLCAGRRDEARRHLGDVLARQPDFSLAHWFLGQLYARQQQYDSAVTHLAEAVRLTGGASRMLADLASARALAGDRAVAQSLLDSLQVLEAGGAAVSRYEYGVVYAALGDRDRAFGALEAAMAERTWQVGQLAVDPMLEPLRDDPRYHALVVRLGLPTAQRD